MRISALMKLTALAALLAVCSTTHGQAPQTSPGGLRWEVWLGLTSWPALQDLQPEAGGDFNEVGFGLGGALHWPVGQHQNGELMLGIDASIDSIDSSIPGTYDNHLERHLYLGGSAKWFPGKSRSFSLDGGVGFHLVDIVQINTNIVLDSVEYEIWEENALGAFVGATWDVYAGRADKRRGLSLGLSVHFVDLGTVRDEDIPFQPIFGSNAGTLAGPLYVFRIAYSGR